MFGGCPECGAGIGRCGRVCGRSGRHWLEACAQNLVNPNCTGQAVGERVGSTKQLVGSSANFRAEHILPHLTPTRRAMLRSQSGPVAGIPFSVAPSSFLTRLEPALFRVLLQRRLSLPLPLPLSKRSCQCGRLLDAFGHHRAACSRSGVLGRRGFSLESGAARVCREAGGRAATNLLVGDMDLGVPNAHDSRRLEVVDGLPLFGGAQFAVDTTLVSAVQGDGQPQRGASDRDAVALNCARKKKETTHTELVRRDNRARLVFWPWRLEAGGLRKTRTFVQLLAQTKGEVGATFDATGGWSRRGACVGTRELSLLHCWNSVEVTGLTGKCHPLTP